MTTRAAHIARAERLLDGAEAHTPTDAALLDGAEAHTPTDAALLAAAHALVALVRHEVGVWDEITTTEGDR